MKHRFTTSMILSAFLILFSAGNVLADENGNGNGNGDPVPVNINGSFEDAEVGVVEDLTGIPGWVLEVMDTADADFEIVDDEAQDGEKSLKVTINALGSNAWNIQVVGDGIPVDPGARYRMTVWMKAESAGSVDVTVGNYSFQEYGRTSQTLVAGQWTQYELEFTITDNETVIRAPLHFNFSNNLDNVVYIDNLQIIEIQETPRRRVPIVVNLADGEVGADFAIETEHLNGDSIVYVTITNDGWDISNPADPDWAQIWSRPISEDHIVTMQVTFPFAGEYKLYMRGRVGSGAADDDSFFYPDSLRGEMAADDTTWVVANQIDVAGYDDPQQWVTAGGAAGTQVWKWLNISDGDYHHPGVTYLVDRDDTTITFQIGGRETGFDMHQIAFGRADLFYTVNMLDNVQAGVTEIPDDPIEIHPGPPLADGMRKFLGNIWAPTQLENFGNYWNQVTPENASKWGSVEGTRGEYNWGGLDASYELAKENDWPFRFHVLIWGGQQPAWMNNLSAEEQLEAIEAWFNAVNERYPDIDYLEVVNEPLHQRPDGVTGEADYWEALGGPGETGWDWVITSFQMARDIFPETTKLMINDYGILGSVQNANRYVEIIDLLLERELIDGIGVQGHAFSTRGSAAGIVNVLDILAATGLPIQVTEMDIDGNPTRSPNITEATSDANQLEDMQRIFPAVWEHPAVEGVTFWGWRPGLWRQDQEAYLVRANGEERPALKWLIEYMQAYTTSVEEEKRQERPSAFHLHSNYPNPFNPSTEIRYEVAKTAHVRITVYDIMGRQVQTLVNEVLSPGQHSVTFQSENLASGVYLYRMQAGDFAQTRRMMLVK